MPSFPSAALTCQLRTGRIFAVHDQIFIASKTSSSPLGPAYAVPQFTRRLKTIARTEENRVTSPRTVSWQRAMRAWHAGAGACALLCGAAMLALTSERPSAEAAAALAAEQSGGEQRTEMLKVFRVQVRVRAGLVHE